MAIPYTGLFIAAICNSRFSHGRYTRSYGIVSSIGPLEGIWDFFQFQAGVVNSHLYH